MNQQSTKTMDNQSSQTIEVWDIQEVTALVEMLLKALQGNQSLQQGLSLVSEKQRLLNQEVKALQARTHELLASVEKSAFIPYLSAEDLKTVERRATKLCNERGIAIKRVNDEYGNPVNSYPLPILDEVLACFHKLN